MVGLTLVESSCVFGVVSATKQTSIIGYDMFFIFVRLRVPCHCIPLFFFLLFLVFFKVR
jgi:hypothetical protein